jgi:hypothetical protein
MAKYKVTLEFEKGEAGANELTVEATSIHATADWILFNSNEQAAAHTVVTAAFPKDRVVSVVIEE